ncbi:MAG: nucleoside monophosphate kinase [Deltaproteobacteria bacterium]|jgi:adenylate kinase|nr:nucleoside monophosphate kinase [Deltaproteobacteria bacterium]
MNNFNLIVTGKSGAGKQPRIDVLVKQYGLKQLSTGDIFRSYLSIYKKLDLNLDLEKFWDEEKANFVDDSKIIDSIKSGCKEKNIEIQDALLGLKATRFVDQGLFVPDYITNKLFEAAFLKHGGKGLTLDGYPRTKAQASFLLRLSLNEGAKIALIVLVENKNELIIKRTVGRRICKNCGKVFHMEYKPPKDGKYCTDCNEEVIQRSDDTTEKIKIRLQEFKEKTLPAITYLEESGIPLVEVPGNLPVFTEEKVKESVMSKVSEYLD